MNVWISIFLVVFLAACSNDMEEVNALVEKKELNVEIAKNVEIIYSDSAVVRMKIIAPVMYRYLDKLDSKVEWPMGLHVDFFEEDKEPNAWLDAKYAVQLDKENKIVVKDSVVLHNNTGDILKSPELEWDHKKELLSTDEFVQIIQTSSKDTITGYGFETDKNFKKFVIKNKFASKRHIDL